MVRKSREKERAEQAGNTDRAQQIDTWMTHYSIQAHSQAFGTTPVHDLLKSIEDKIPQIASEAKVDAIFSKWEFDYLHPDAELVDVTMQLVRSYQPKPGTEQAIKELLATKPMSFEEILQREIESKH